MGPRGHYKELERMEPPALMTGAAAAGRVDGQGHTPTLIRLDGVQALWLDTHRLDRLQQCSERE